MVVNFVIDAFQKGRFEEFMNEYLITLVPKQEGPETIAQFRPVALCNVITNLITKIVENRLKPLMKNLVSLSQSSFVSNRHASDNIIIVQELIHSMKRKTRKKGIMAIKVDLENAYDRI